MILKDPGFGPLDPKWALLEGRLQMAISTQNGCFGVVNWCICGLHAVWDPQNGPKMTPFWTYFGACPNMWDFECDPGIHGFVHEFGALVDTHGHVIQRRNGVWPKGP